MKSGSVYEHGNGPLIYTVGHRFVTLEDEESDSGFEDDKDTDYDWLNDSN